MKKKNNKRDFNMKKRVYLIRAFWDSEAKVYVATSDDVPGLVAEASNPAELEKKLKILIPELLELNGAWPDDLPEVPFKVLSEFASKACRN